MLHVFFFFCGVLSGVQLDRGLFRVARHLSQHFNVRGQPTFWQHQRVIKDGFD